MGKPWTTVEVARLRELAKQHTAAQCATLLGRTLPSVRNVLHKRKIPIQKYGAAHHHARHSDEVFAEAWRLRQANKTLSQIVERTGIPHNTLKSVICNGRARNFQAPADPKRTFNRRAPNADVVRAL